MKIGLIDVDGHNFPNIPLMKLSAYHKSIGDSVEWYQPLFSGHMDKVYMSKVFSFTPDYEYFIDADVIDRGGSGYAIELVDGKEQYNKAKDKLLPDEIEHIYPDYSLYPELTKDTAYGFLTRGCPRGCGFCHVASKEGKCSYKVADLSEFWRGQKNIELLDPNILACPQHMELLHQLSESKAKINFNQGLDIRFINDRNIEILKQIDIKYIHIAFDDFKQIDVIEPRMRMLRDKIQLDHRHIVCYILVNFDTSIEQDIYRIQLCRKLDFAPYPMIYDKEHCDPVYKKLQRWCNNIIFWKVKTFEEYLNYRR